MSGRLTVRAEDLSDLRNLGYKAGGFYLTAVPEEYGAPPCAMRRWTRHGPPRFNGRSRLAQGVLMTYLPDDRGGWPFNHRRPGSLSEEAQDAFGLSGVSHLIAVSGLHMAILSQAVMSLLKKLRIPRCPAALLTMAGVCAAIWRWLDSALRWCGRGVLCLVVLLGSCVRRRSDSLNSIGSP